MEDGRNVDFANLRCLISFVTGVGIPRARGEDKSCSKATLGNIKHTDRIKHKSVLLTNNAHLWCFAPLSSRCHCIACPTVHGWQFVSAFQPQKTYSLE